MAKFVDLDLGDREAVGDAHSFMYGDLKRVFGEDSAEYQAVWANDPNAGPFFLGSDDDLDEGAWHRADKLLKRKTEHDKVVARLRRLVDRARELAELHNSMKGDDDMGIRGIYDKMSAPFTLVKGSGDRASHKGIRDTAKSTVQVHDLHFDAEPGEMVEFPQPNGKLETWEVVTSSHVPVPHMPDMEHYIVKLRQSSARPAAPPPQVVHQNNYNISGSTIGAVGENATVANSHVIGQALQWNGIDPKTIAAELKTLRKELAAAADGEGEGAAHAEADLEHVSAANKALAANDEGAFKSAIKKLSAFGWKLFEKATTAITIGWLRAHGAIPGATPHHEALPAGGE